MTDNVFGFGRPILPYRYSRRKRQLGGMRLTTRVPSETALLLICDAPRGLVIYDFEDRTLFQRGEAEAWREELRRREFHDASVAMSGSCELGHQSAHLIFDSSSHPDPIELLIGLLCRAFAYTPLHYEARRLLHADPLVSYDGHSLGKLGTIIEDAREVHKTRFAPAPRLV